MFKKYKHFNSSNLEVEAFLSFIFSLDLAAAPQEAWLPAMEIAVHQIPLWRKRFCGIVYLVAFWNTASKNLNTHTQPFKRHLQTL